MGGALLGERSEQKRILNGDVRVEIRVEHTARNIELAAQFEIDVDGPPVRTVRCGTHVLVVIHFGNRRSPIDDKPPIRVIGHARITDIEFLCLFAGFELQDHLCEIRLLEQHLDAGKFLGIQVVRDVVAVDHAVHRGEIRIGFHRIGIAREVGGELFGHRALVFSRRFVQRSDFRRERPTHGFQRFVRIAQVLLLLSEDGVDRAVGLCDCLSIALGKANGVSGRSVSRFMVAGHAILLGTVFWASAYDAFLIGCHLSASRPPKRRCSKKFGQS